MPLYYLHNSLSDAGIRLLDMQHLGDGRSNVCDVYLAAGAAMFHFPAIEQQGDVGIVGIPLAMGRTHRR